MDHNIDRLRFAAMEVLLRLSKRFARKRLGTIFLITNFHHIVQVPYSPISADTFQYPSLRGDKAAKSSMFMTAWVHMCSFFVRQPAGEATWRMPLGHLPLPPQPLWEPVAQRPSRNSRYSSLLPFDTTSTAKGSQQRIPVHPSPARRISQQPRLSVYGSWFAGPVDGVHKHLRGGGTGAAFWGSGALCDGGRVRGQGGRCA